MLGGMSTCLSAQQLAKVASKHITQLCFANNEDLIIFQNTLDGQQFAVEKIIKRPLYNCGVLYVITRMHSVLWCGSLPFTAVAGSSVPPFTQSHFHDLMHLAQDLFSVSMSQGMEET